MIIYKILEKREKYMNIKEALEYGIELLKKNDIDESILKTRILLANVLGRSKEYLMIYENEQLDENTIKRYREKRTRRKKAFGNDFSRQGHQGFYRQRESQAGGGDLQADGNQTG